VRPDLGRGLAEQTVGRDCQRLGNGRDVLARFSLAWPFSALLSQPFECPVRPASVSRLMPRDRRAARTF
jgi:hypothetical protein